MIITGKVIEGQKKASGFGFPTANIENTSKISVGIYAGEILFDNKKYRTAIYIGTPRPDILEAHLIDFIGDLYGKEISVEVLEKIRDDYHEQNFEVLKKMIANDVEIIKNYKK